RVHLTIIPYTTLFRSTAGRREIRNPLHQVSRMEILLRNVLNQGKFNFSIESKVVFTHSEFFLYQAPLDAPLIFPTQINRFIEERSEEHTSELQSRFDL